MEFNLTASTLVNAGGALLFVLEGVAILAIGRGRSRNLLLGLLAVLYGLTFIADNLLVRGDSVRDALILSFAAPTIVATLLLTAMVARNLDRTGWLALAATFAVFAVSFALAFRQLVAVGPDLGWFVALGGSVALLMMATGLRTRRPLSGGDIPGLALGLLALGFGVWGGFAQMLTLSIGSLPSGWVQAGTFGICSATLAGILAWAVPSPSAPWRLRVFLALGGAAAIGMGLASSFFTDPSVFGIFGIMRTVGAACLAIAVAKYNLLGVPLPRFAVKRGVLATAALAALFVVAQVAQNFFAAQYGLLMGGVVAGAVVFAASPIQRAMERASDRKSPATAAPTAAPAARRERTYRNALRIALRDRKLTAQEEAHLFELAEDLGIGAGRAFQIKSEVAAERMHPATVGKRRAA